MACRRDSVTVVGRRGRAYKAARATARILHLLHWNAYSALVPLVQVRDVSEATVRALKSHAAEHGLTLTAFLRVELDKLAARPTNAEIVERLARRDRSGGPTVADTVAEIRRTREAM